MRAIGSIIATVVLVVGLPLLALAATISNSQYAIQYDYRDFFAATDNNAFRVILLGNPYPNMEVSDVALRLLPVMQANKPPPNLTFTYNAPAESQHPDYRLVLIFNAANDLGSNAVCNGVSRFRAAMPGRVYVYAVYCRNDLALSEATGLVDSTEPDDPGMNDLMRSLFAVVFSNSPYLQRNEDGHSHGR